MQLHVKRPGLWVTGQWKVTAVSTIHHSLDGPNLASIGKLYKISKRHHVLIRPHPAQGVREPGESRGPEQGDPS